MARKHMNDLWVFGYGSLMWRPGFEHVEQRPALLYGYHRSFCVYSHVHRGTPEKPGLVFGLDLGGACRGIAFRVKAALAEEVLDYLRAREQVTMVYRETRHMIHLMDQTPREKVGAVAFVVDRGHSQYAGRIGFDDQVRIVAEGRGQSGKNPEYLAQTVQHMNEIGIRDEALNRLWQAVEARPGQRARNR